MDAVLIARQLRLATIMNLFHEGLLEEKDARELLDGPLTPGDDSTIVRDSKYFDNPEELIRASEQRNEAVKTGVEEQNMYECGNCGVPRFVHNGILEACPMCGDDETELSLYDDVP